MEFSWVQVTLAPEHRHSAQAKTVSRISIVTYCQDIIVGEREESFSTCDWSRLNRSELLLVEISSRLSLDIAHVAKLLQDSNNCLAIYSNFDGLLIIKTAHNRATL